MDTLAKKETNKLNINTKAYTNLSETEQAYFIDVFLPGYDKSMVKIELNNNSLTIESKESDEFSTFALPPFKRSIALPKNSINEDSAEAVFENGILQVKLEKQKKEKKEIAIQ